MSGIDEIEELLRTRIARNTQGGSTVSLPVTARGAVKINGRIWPYVRGRFFVLATERSLFRFTAAKAGPPIETGADRDTAEALLTRPMDRVVFEPSGKSLRELHAAMSNTALAGGLESVPIRVGNGVYNLLALAVLLMGVADDEKGVVGEAGEALRVDMPRARFALAATTDGVPMGEIEMVGSFTKRGRA